MIKRDSSEAQRIRVAKIYHHAEADATLLKMVEPVDSKYVPIPLANASDAPESTMVTAMGWGNTREGGRKPFQ